jgi:DNA-binding transcriptional regulator YdaS (Cro superfamily)
MKHGFGIADDALAEILGVHRSTLQRWYAGTANLHPGHANQFERIWYIYTVMVATLGRDAIPGYMRTYTDALRGQKPFDLLKRGRFRPVLKDLRQISETKRSVESDVRNKLAEEIFA